MPNQHKINSAGYTALQQKIFDTLFQLESIESKELLAEMVDCSPHSITYAINKHSRIAELYWGKKSNHLRNRKKVKSITLEEHLIEFSKRNGISQSSVAGYLESLHANR